MNDLTQADLDRVYEHGYERGIERGATWGIACATLLIGGACSALLWLAGVL